MFRNPQDLQNLKLSLKFNFEQDFMEKKGKTYATNEIAGTVSAELKQVLPTQSFKVVEAKCYTDSCVAQQQHQHLHSSGNSTNLFVLSEMMLNCSIYLVHFVTK